MEAITITEEQRKQIAEFAANLEAAIIRAFYPLAQCFSEFGHRYKNTKRFRWRNWDKARKIKERQLSKKEETGMSSCNTLKNGA